MQLSVRVGTKHLWGRAVWRAAKTLGRPHATLSFLAREDLQSPSERMGRKSVTFTQDESIDALPVMQRMAAARLENRLLRTNLAQVAENVTM